MDTPFTTSISTNQLSSEEWLTVVGLLDGEVIATCEVSNWSKPIPFIRALVVQPDHRSKGFGSRIIHACITMCLAHRKTALAINVENTNTRALKLYKQLGFVPAVMGYSDDTIWLSKFLSHPENTNP